MKYSAEFALIVEKTSTGTCKYSTEDLLVTSEVLDFTDMIYFDADFYFGHEEIKKLEDGEYFVFVIGDAEFESDVDWESGIEEGHYWLGVDYIKILPLDKTE